MRAIILFLAQSLWSNIKECGDRSSPLGFGDEFNYKFRIDVSCQDHKCEHTRINACDT